PDPALAARLGLLRDAQGVAAVEFALVLPLLLLLLAGLTDVSRAILTSLWLKAAAQAGGDYAASRGWSPTAKPLSPELLGQALRRSLARTGEGPGAPPRRTAALVGARGGVGAT